MGEDKSLVRAGEDDAVIACLRLISFFVWRTSRRHLSAPPQLSSLAGGRALAVENKRCGPRAALFDSILAHFDALRVPSDENADMRRSMAENSSSTLYPARSRQA